MGHQVSRVKPESNPFYDRSEKTNLWLTHFFDGSDFKGQKWVESAGQANFCHSYMTPYQKFQA